MDASLFQEHVEGFTWLQLALSLVFPLMLVVGLFLLREKELWRRKLGRLLLAGCLFPLSWLLMDVPEWFGFTLPIAVGMAVLMLAAILSVLVLMKGRWR